MLRNKEALPDITDVSKQFIGYAIGAHVTQKFQEVYKRGSPLVKGAVMDETVINAIFQPDILSTKLVLMDRIIPDILVFNPVNDLVKDFIIRTMSSDAGTNLQEFQQEANQAKTELMQPSNNTPEQLNLQANLFETVNNAVNRTSVLENLRLFVSVPITAPVA
ncbi:MAG: hypothetical protein ACJAXL_001273 [Alphaproteobacteria bacterium]|jgi:hypothetical protein